MSFKILIVDDHEVARIGLSVILGGDEFSTNDVAADGHEAVEMLDSNSFDIVLLDIRMKGRDGLQTLEKIREQHQVPVVIVSSYDNPTYIARAAALGANDYVLKNGCSKTLTDSLSRAARKQPLSSESRLSQIIEAMRSEVDPSTLPEALPLTNREAQVLKHIALGLSNREIGKSLSISVETVKEHVQNILRKTPASDRTAAAVLAIQLGLIA